METLSTFRNKVAKQYMADSAVRKLYGINQDNASFDNYFSKVSVEGILVYMWAFVAWVLAALFEQYRTDINDEIANLKPHSLRWYVEKVKAYQEQDGTPDKLPTDEYGQVNSDTYAAIAEERRIVKYASAQEVNGQIAIKVAGISDGEPCQIKDKSLLNIKYYMSQIKDAGVPVSVNTYPADKIKLTVAIYYNPLKINEEDVKNQVVAAVKQAVKNLPFNGDCKTSDLSDAIRDIDGIEVADILTFQAGAAYGEYINVSGYYTPVSGYFTIGKHNIDFSILQPYANGQQI